MLGLALAGFSSWLSLDGSVSVRAAWPWLAAAALAGVMLAHLSILLPAWAEARRLSVAAARMPIGTDHVALWRRAHLDLVLIAIAALIFWRTASSRATKYACSPRRAPRAFLSRTPRFWPRCCFGRGQPSSSCA